MRRFTDWLACPAGRSQQGPCWLCQRSLQSVDLLYNQPCKSVLILKESPFKPAIWQSPKEHLLHIASHLYPQAVTRCLGVAWMTKLQHTREAETISASRWSLSRLCVGLSCFSRHLYTLQQHALPRDSVPHKVIGIDTAFCGRPSPDPQAIHWSAMST